MELKWPESTCEVFKDVSNDTTQFILYVVIISNIIALELISGEDPVGRLTTKGDILTTGVREVTLWNIRGLKVEKTGQILDYYSVDAIISAMLFAGIEFFISVDSVGYAFLFGGFCDFAPIAQQKLELDFLDEFGATSKAYTLTAVGGPLRFCEIDLDGFLCWDAIRCSVPFSNSGEFLNMTKVVNLINSPDVVWIATANAELLLGNARNGEIRLLGDFNHVGTGSATTIDQLEPFGEDVLVCVLSQDSRRIVVAFDIEDLVGISTGASDEVLGRYFYEGDMVQSNVEVKDDILVYMVLEGTQDYVFRVIEASQINDFPKKPTNFRLTAERELLCIRSNSTTSPSRGAHHHQQSQYLVFVFLSFIFFVRI